MPRNRSLPRIKFSRQINLPCSKLLISLIAYRPQVHCFVSLLFSFLGLTRMTISLLKDAARLFMRAAADIDFHHCMIFSNFQNFKLACIFGISKFNMNFMNRFSVMHRASELAYNQITFVWRFVWRPKMACVCQGAPRR